MVSPRVYKTIIALAEEVLGALSGMSRYERRYYVAFISGFPPDGAVDASLPTASLIDDLLDPLRGGLPFHLGSPRHRIAGFVGLASGDGDYESARARAAWMHELLESTIGSVQVLDNVDVVRLNEPRPGFNAVGADHAQNRGVAVVLAVDHLRPPLDYVPPTDGTEWEIDFTGTVDVGAPGIEVLSASYTVGTLRNLATMERRMVRLIGASTGFSLNLKLPVTLSVNLFPAPHQFTTYKSVDFDDFDFTEWDLLSREATVVYEIDSYEDFRFPALGARLLRENFTLATDITVDLMPRVTSGLTIVGGVV
jgi:hypothetical protein